MVLAGIAFLSFCWGGADADEVTIDDADRQFWSFQPLSVSAAPEVTASDWVRTPIDRFILAKLEASDLTPNSNADWRTLVRRAYFDLTGLPPTPAEFAQFLAAPSHQALDQLVRQLLASPNYGERWARHWLDVARFAESGGFEHDDDRPHAYRYRDFVIRALNDDMPFDQFVRWQLAGDELAGDDPLALMATGFLVAGVFPSQLTEAEFERARYDQLDDMAGTTGVAFLGLTIGCARCHDHKFDPIPKHDYYRLIATFTTTVPSEIDLDDPEFEVGSDKQETETEAETETETEKQQRRLALIASEGRKPVSNHADSRGYPHFYPETYILNRGDPNQKQGLAEMSYLQVLMREGKSAPDWRVTAPANSRTSFRRASLASWLTDTQHGAGHLVARVIVNRLWQHHFGRGIVATPNDFGEQGTRPTHPELLDWLAGQLIDNRWQLKTIHRLMMASSVYRQASRYDSEDAQIDPENNLLWRFNYRRLQAEVVRDSMLAVGGLLDREMYGPGTLDEQMHRRSIYFTVKRSKLIPSMQLLDMPESLVSIADRSNTTIAPQALMFLNSPHVRACAEGLAGQIAAKSDASWEAVIQTGYQLALSRDPTPQELAAHQQQLEAEHAEYEAAGEPDPRQLVIANLCQLLISLNEFIYVE